LKMRDFLSEFMSTNNSAEENTLSDSYLKTFCKLTLCSVVGLYDHIVFMSETVIVSVTGIFYSTMNLKTSSILMF